MPAGKDPPQSDKDLASEIDKLLKKLPHADPSLSGAQASSAAPPAGIAHSARAAATTATKSTPIDGKILLAVWGRVALVGLFGLALTQWPFARDCGWGLVWYAAAVATLLVAGGWCAMVTWEHRVGLAHIVSLVVGFWGIVLSAEMLLPRFGYSVDRATWRCVSAAAVAPAPTIPAAPATIAPPADSVALQSTDTLGAVASSLDSGPTTLPR
jgi:hypothetical protein